MFKNVNNRNGFQPLRSSILYAMAFFLYLLDLPFTSDALPSSAPILLFGLLGTVCFLMDFVKIYRRVSCENKAESLTKDIPKWKVRLQLCLKIGLAIGTFAGAVVLLKILT